MRALLALAIVTLVLGCASRPKCPVYPSRVAWKISSYGTSMPSENQRKEILKAMETWEKLLQSCSTNPVDFEEAEVGQAVNLDISFVQTGLGEGTLGRVDCYAPDPRRNQTLQFNEGATRFTDGPGEPTGHTVSLYGVALHELGHVLGLWDNDSPDSVMCFVYPSTATAPSAADVERLQAIYGWREVVDAEVPAGPAGCVASAEAPR